jgi:glycosyltransferase involved in cell wall biosynthesis
MRILILGCKEYPFGSSSRYDKKAGGGIEIHVEKLAKHLSKDGHDVFIITRKFPGQKEEEHITASHVKGKIHIYRIGFSKNIFLRTFTFNRNAAKKARDIIGEIDIIHCHGPVAGFFGSALAKKFKKPMVFTPHGIVVDWSWFVRRFISYFERKSFRNAGKNIFVSEKAMIELGGNAENSVLLSNAVDMDDYKETKKSWKGTRFLFLGRLEDVKGIDYLLDAFKKLSDK